MASGRRSYAGRAAGAGRPGQVLVSARVRPRAPQTSTERVQGVREDVRAVGEEGSSDQEGALAGGVEDAGRAHEAGSLLRVLSHAFLLPIASFWGVVRTQPSIAQASRRWGLVVSIRACRRAHLKFMFARFGRAAPRISMI